MKNPWNHWGSNTCEEWEYTVLRIGGTANATRVSISIRPCPRSQEIPSSLLSFQWFSSPGELQEITPDYLAWLNIVGFKGLPRTSRVLITYVCTAAQFAQFRALELGTEATGWSSTFTLAAGRGDGMIIDEYSSLPDCRWLLSSAAFTPQNSHLEEERSCTMLRAVNHGAPTRDSFLVGPHWLQAF